MFEIATRTKMRFPFKGMVSVVDLWDLYVIDLDSIFKTLNAQVKKSQEESLLIAKTMEDENLAIQIEIVKHIVKTKLDEAETAKHSKELKDKKQKLMEMIAEKKDEALRNASVEELQAMLDNLGE